MNATLVARGGSVGGTIQLPGDKSISHRAAMFAALANGPSDLHGFLEGEDCLATLKVLQALGIRVERVAATHYRVSGRGAADFDTSIEPLDFGNSGTGLRLMAGILAGRGTRAVLTGDASLQSRPMARIIEPLRAMGANVDSREGRLPLVLRGGRLSGKRHVMSVASAQLKSCLLLAGLHASGKSWVVEQVPTRDHTERMMSHFGVPWVQAGKEIGVERCDWDGIPGRSVDIPGDPSSAAFFAVAAALIPGAELHIRQVGLNPGRTAYLEILRRFGATVEVVESGLDGIEPVGDVFIRGGELKAVKIAAHEVPALIDELPVLMIAAATAQGRSRIEGAGELRVKESDRLAVMAEGLTALGIVVHLQADSIDIHGGRMSGGTVDAHQDHRIAMAFAVAALRASASIKIQRCAEIATSFPGFESLAQSVGMEVGQA